MSGVYFQGGGAPRRDTTMRDLIGVLFKYKWLIIGITAFAVVFVSIKTLQAPVTFTADSTLMLDRQGARASVLDRTGRQLPWIEVIESEVQVLQSTPVLQGALTHLEAAGITDIRLGALGRSLKAGIVGESNVVYVSATSKNGDHSVEIANAVAQSYVEYHRRIFSLPDPSPFLQARADSVYGILTELQQRRSQLFTEIGVTDVEEQEKSLIREASSLRVELSEIEVKTARLETEIEDGRRAIGSGNYNLPFQGYTGAYQGMNLGNTIRMYEEGQQKLAQLRSKYTEQHPEVMELRNQNDAQRETLDSWVNQQISIKEHELRVVLAEQARVRTNLAELEARLAELPELVQELSLADAKIMTTQQQYDDINEHLVTTEVNAVSFRDYGVKILSPAVRARKNSKGDPVRIALGPILALIASIGLAFYLENLDHTLRNREDVEEHFEIPVLASFPDVDLEAEASPPPRGRRLPFQKKSTR